ncbi:unnamed protein product [Cladocopium goreaui]|uniref:Uncharacterized protein n=1 Tax=Cladocopium goreaui TaxID=2562237 RepID=A0A9P1CPP3_9DINO|nr:unnamed protein product [Cladocopium goreaui]
MFPDHVTLFADFAVPEKITSTLTWLRPTSIPWDKINQETWHHNLGRLPAPDHQQGRRPQSYKHAAVANKQTLDAEVCRLILWSAIKKGRGFDGFFHVWWLRRRIRSPSAPVTFRLAPPDGFTAEQIFLDFKKNFEAFEQRHCRQRRKLLQLKCDHSFHRLFHELRPPKRDQLDILWHTKGYTILAVDLATHQIHVDQPVNDLTGCAWFINNTQVEVETAMVTCLDFTTFLIMLNQVTCCSATTIFLKLHKCIKR